MVTVFPRPVLAAFSGGDLGRP